ncbi:MAG: hypothetical protein M3406_03860 [Chloroflexota bacterium]|nr:hypothetical protein [Chloroflexota bacterium]
MRHALFEDPSLRDSGARDTMAGLRAQLAIAEPAKRERIRARMWSLLRHQVNRPEVHEVLRELR